MIKHKTFHSIRYGKGEYYLCNQAVNVTPEKVVYRWDKVTCKNCLKHKEG